jgi:NADPH-dependent 2,4-dienoyl-CoA reductase/sulfur reductase-like enzyme
MTKAHKHPSIVLADPPPLGRTLLGDSDLDRPRVCIIGAGAAGLAAARQLINAGALVTLVFHSGVNRETHDEVTGD